MAIRPIDQYPGRVGAVSAEYPDGKARDRSGPGLQDGTPLGEDWVNDFFGFEQALLSFAGLTASGTPEQVGASQLLDAILKMVLNLLGFDAPVPYTSGLSITTKQQTVIENNQIYWYNGTLPLTTSGTLEADFELVQAAITNKNAQFANVVADDYSGPTA